jgi:pyridoxal phosphate enzyme (YggS family)
MKRRITDNLKRIKDNIGEACARAKREPSDVRVVAVTKSVDLDSIRSLLELQQGDVAESRVQELVQRHAMIDEHLKRRHEMQSTAGSEAVMVKPRWHMVGHLQRNKVRQLLPIVEMIHSVDSLRLAEEINTAAARLGLANKVDVLLEVNTSQEKQKHGLAVGAVSALAEQLETLANLRIMGLMTMAPQSDDPEKSRFFFGRLREILEEMRGERVVSEDCRHLSMGMSGDYVTAVEEGATLVRIGRALFE